ncbi:DUF308 domain-containing protein [Spongiactinospora sp. TRM90649]|uniref:HdeD family acid-resistance protein n=1 Tax=Spongiactinospora sp. TRM90649 TaxID=3031114 RepID=UPI0023F898B4|nr:DUF308 domain-containing protein [Spongiactinospora sp. TRM90649]MDF5751812.1 DUF308 domain-containing protein [Spongiactinospora sp. TRM90649]
MTSATTPDGRGFMPHLADRAWSVVVASAIVSVLLGAAVLVWPEVTIGVLAVLLGVELVVHGVFRVVQAIMVGDRAAVSRVMFALLGVISLALGVLALRNPPQTVLALALLAGLFWLAGGVIEFVTVLGDRSGPRWGWRLVGPVLSVLAGVVLLVYPGLSLLALVWLLGFWLVVWGLVTVAVTFWVRHAERGHAAPPPAPA